MDLPCFWSTGRIHFHDPVNANQGQSTLIGHDITINPCAWLYNGPADPLPKSVGRGSARFNSQLIWRGLRMNLVTSWLHKPITEEAIPAPETEEQVPEAYRQPENVGCLSRKG